MKIFKRGATIIPVGMSIPQAKVGIKKLGFGLELEMSVLRIIILTSIGTQINSQVKWRLPNKNRDYQFLLSIVEILQISKNFLMNNVDCIVPRSKDFKTLLSIN